MACPIIFIHQGEGGPFYHLNLAILQARWWNPDADVFVIADEACRTSLVVPGITVVNLEEYAESGAELRAVYQHFSPNPESFELFCMVRWFVLRDFMRRQHVDKVWHLDSDVMLYATVEEEERHLQAADYTYTRASGHSSFFTQPAVDHLCELMLGTYGAEDASRRLHDLWEKGKAEGYKALSDMTFFLLMAREGRLRGVNREFPGADGAAHSVNVRGVSAYSLPKELMVLEFRNQRPHGRRLTDGGWDRFATLHFQGAAKCFMKEYLRPPGDALPSWSVACIAGLFAELERGHPEATTRRASMAHALSEAHQALKQLSKNHDRATQGFRTKAGKFLRKVEEIAELRTLRWAEKLRLSRAHRRLLAVVQSMKDWLETKER